MNKNMKQVGFGLCLAGLVACMCMISAEGVKGEEGDDQKMQVSSDGRLENVFTEALDSEAEVQDEQEPITCNRDTMAKKKIEVGVTQIAYETAREEYEAVIAKAKQTMRKAEQAYQNAVVSTERHEQDASVVHDKADFAATDAQRMYQKQTTACGEEDEANRIAEMKQIAGRRAAKFDKAVNKIGNSAIWCQMRSSEVAEVALKLKTHCETKGKKGGAAATLSTNVKNLDESVKDFGKALTTVREGLFDPANADNKQKFQQVIEAKTTMVSSWDDVKGKLSIEEKECLPAKWYNMFGSTSSQEVASNDYKQLAADLKLVKTDMNIFVTENLNGLEKTMNEMLNSLE